MRKRFTFGTLLKMAGLVLLVLGGALALQGQVEVMRAARWPMVEGRITDARYSYNDIRPSLDTRAEFYPSLEYRYQVDGTVFTGDRAWLGRRLVLSSGQEFDSFFATYQVGSTVWVRYDPADPARSALFVKPDWWRLRFLIPGTVLLVIGLALNALLRRFRPLA